MKKIALLPIIISLFISCSPSKKSTTDMASTSTSTSSSSSSTSSANDGSSYEKAIIIEKKNEKDGVAEEYKWLREHYPGYTMGSQSLNYKDKKPYDILHITTKDGEKKDVYFDISKFFGKF